jgi:signal transduction histidine kinase
VLAGRGSTAEGEARLADGGSLEVAVAPWRGGDGRPAGLVVVMLDVTTARRLRDQITQSEKLSSLGRMIAGVAHELNNPLTAVIGYAQLLRTSPGATKGPHGSTRSAVRPSGAGASSRISSGSRGRTRPSGARSR